MDSDRYREYASGKEEEFESICRRCGECCGSLDDPCRNLIRMDDGKYFCRDYANRLGPQRTVSGRHFNCISIREHISKDTLRPSCAYRRLIAHVQKQHFYQ